MGEKERNYIITYKGKEILYFDHSGLGEDDLFNNVKAAFRIEDEYKGKDILAIANWVDTTMTKETMDYVKSDEVVRINKKIKKTALLGFTGIKKIFLNVYNKLTGDKAKAFNTEEEAKEWLVQD